LAKPYALSPGFGRIAVSLSKCIPAENGFHIKLKKLCTGGISIQ